MSDFVLTLPDAERGGSDDGSASDSWDLTGEEEEEEKITTKPSVSPSASSSSRKRRGGDTSFFAEMYGNKRGNGDEIPQLGARANTSWSLAGVLQRVNQNAADEGTVDANATSIEDKIAKQLDRRRAKALRRQQKGGKQPQKATDKPVSATKENVGSSISSSSSSADGSGDEPEDAVDEMLDIDDASKRARSKEPNTDDGGALTFDDMGLSRALMRAVVSCGFTKPTPIQARAIPVAMAGHDLVGSAVTGSGKTAAFLLPLLQRITTDSARRQYAAIRAMILLPTRELAAQCHAMLTELAKFTDVRAVLAIGGDSLKQQEAILRTNPDVLIGTPGRIIDHLRNSHGVGLEDLQYLVLDEADRLLELGFKDEIEEILKYCPGGIYQPGYTADEAENAYSASSSSSKKAAQKEKPKLRQSLLFSATLSSDVNELVSLSLRSPIRVAVDRQFDVASTLSQEFVKVRLGTVAQQKNKSRDPFGETNSMRAGALLALCTRTFRSRTMIFAAHKFSAHWLRILFGLAGLNAAELHGNLTQAKRLQALEDFRIGKCDFLIATDVAARGLDIPGVETVVNYCLPGDIASYVHRVGRCARAGRQGRSVSISNADSLADRKLLKQISKAARGRLQQRVVNTDAVEAAARTVDSLEMDIEAVLQQERKERMLRQAEQELQTAENMMTFEEEIFSRPKRTWFMTEREKTSLQRQRVDSFEHNRQGGKRDREAFEDDGGAGNFDGNGDDADMEGGMTNRQIHRMNKNSEKQSAKDAARDARRKELSKMPAQKRKKVLAHDSQDDKSQFFAAKAAKRTDRDRKAGKVVPVARAASGGSKSSFDADARKPRPKTASAFQEYTKGKIGKDRGFGRGGVKKGHHGFKSKAKYKRKH